MKNRLASFLVSFVLLLSITLLAPGCATNGGDGPSQSFIARILDRTLPRDFTGPIYFREKTPWGKIVISGDGLRHGENGWNWTWLKWHREGNVSEGVLIIGKAPPTPAE